MHRFHGGCTKQLFITQSFVVTLLLTANIVTLAPVGSVIAQRNVADTNSTSTSINEAPHSQFSANLTAELSSVTGDLAPTGSREFSLVEDGNTMSYKIDANDIDRVTDDMYQPQVEDNL
jgi:hypothetical protein